MKDSGRVVIFNISDVNVNQTPPTTLSAPPHTLFNTIFSAFLFVPTTSKRNIPLPSFLDLSSLTHHHHCRRRYRHLYHQSEPPLRRFSFLFLLQRAPSSSHHQSQPQPKSQSHQDLPKETWTNNSMHPALSMRSTSTTASPGTQAAAPALPAHRHFCRQRRYRYRRHFRTTRR